MSFLAGDGKSNRVCSVILAEQPNQVQSFGVGEKLPFLQHGLSAPQLHPVPPFCCLQKSERCCD